jgi:UDP-2,3-diacylglucosamine hydrolase
VVTLFISDLHLSLERPEMLLRFKHLLRGPARQAIAVYLLGDLFEQFWVGFDDITPPNQEIINELLDFTRHGPPLYIIKGNRDLLLDEKFCMLTGAILLPDQAIINLNGKRVLLMHGDLLCINDYKYQRFRSFIVNPVIRFIINLMPYRFRIWLSHGLKPIMNRSVKFKPAEIMDVDQNEVVKVMQQNNVTDLIHGHTHRPGLHQFEIDSDACQRIVLGDWYGEAKILICQNESRRLVPVQEYLQECENN